MPRITAKMGPMSNEFSLAIICITIKNARRQLRAYVFADDIKIGNVFGVPPPEARVGEATEGAWRFQPSIGPIVNVCIKNSGQTPAFDLIHLVGLCIREYPLNSELPILMTEDNIAHVTRMTIPPGGKFFYPTYHPTPLSEQTIEGLRNRTAAIYVYGEIRFIDAFKQKRFTKYRAFHNSITGEIGKTTTMTGCEKGNEAN
jgi:hypothetical protein